MKRLITLFATVFSLSHAFAQIPNPGFEVRDTDGNPLQWGAGNIQVFQMDPNCNYAGWDSVLTSTTDAHTGYYAYEVRTAVACGEAASGVMQPSEYHYEFGATEQRIPMSFQPGAITFYYKLTSVQHDFGLVDCVMETQAGSRLGSGELHLPATATWTKATLPMEYAVHDTGGFVRLRFRIGNDTQVHYGSRFMVDDLACTAATGVGNNARSITRLTCFPSPANNTISVNLPDARAGADALITLSDLTGRILLQKTLQIPRNLSITLGIEQLPPSYYCITVTAGGQNAAGHFLKQ